MICPNAECISKLNNNNDQHSLEIEMSQYGFATEVFVRCRCCSWGTAIAPPKAQEKGDSPNNTPTKMADRESELFHKYAINYSAGFLLQKLGIGLRGLDAMFAFLGIAPNHGSDFKWNKLLDRIGIL